MRFVNFIKINVERYYCNIDTNHKQFICSMVHLSISAKKNCQQKIERKIYFVDETLRWFHYHFYLIPLFFLTIFILVIHSFPYRFTTHFRIVFAQHSAAFSFYVNHFLILSRSLSFAMPHSISFVMSFIEKKNSTSIRYTDKLNDKYARTSNGKSKFGCVETKIHCWSWLWWNMAKKNFFQSFMKFIFIYLKRFVGEKKK